MATRIIKKPSIKIEVKDGKYKPFIFDNGKKRYLCDSDEPEPIEPTNRILYTVVEGGYKPESSWITENCSDNVFNAETGEGYLVVNEGVNTIECPGDDEQEIYPNMFDDSGEDSNIATVAIPTQITSIGYDAFVGCSNLTSVTIPNSVTSIGNDAFYRCDGLTSVTIPSSVTSIGNGTFDSCTSLASVTCFATTPPTLGSEVFKSINTNTCGVPSTSIDAYYNDKSWTAAFATFVAADV